MTRIESSPSQIAAQSQAQFIIRKGDTLSALAVGHHISLTELQNANPALDPLRLKIGQAITIPSAAKPVSVIPYPVKSNTLDNGFERAFKLTRTIESGNNTFAAYQNYDKGIVSYGCIQFTLQSGNLQYVVQRFINKSNSQASKTLRSYIPWPSDLEGLRDDKRFASALILAANERAMQAAQLEVVKERFWSKAESRASAMGLNSTLAKAILFDTIVQGGLSSICEHTTKRLAGSVISAQGYLNVFLDERTKYLESVAPQTLNRLEIFKVALSQRNLSLDQF